MFGKDCHRVEVNSVSKQKQKGIAVLISDKNRHATKIVRRDKEGHKILINGIFYHYYVRIINICKINIGLPTFIKQTQ